MLSRKRSAWIVRPRQIAMYLCRKMLWKSFPEIGRRFGDKDHTVALHATRKISALIGDGSYRDYCSDPTIEAIVLMLQDMIGRRFSVHWPAALDTISTAGLSRGVPAERTTP
jgi:hypothetical protein